MIERRPRVLRDTVLPPVLGPLMMSCRVSGGRMMVSGTGVFGASLGARDSAAMRSCRRGWRAAVRDSSGAKVGRTQARSLANRARAKWDSTSARMAAPSWIVSEYSPRARVMATRMRWISDCSSSRSRTSSLFCSIVSSGSTKTVAPEEDEP